MQYTLILTEKPEGGIQITIPALPACTLEAATRDEAVRLAHEAITQMVSHREIVQIDIPQQPRGTSQANRVPWKWFGEVKSDPSWDALFDDLEQRREAYGMRMSPPSLPLARARAMAPHSSAAKTLR